MIDPRLVAVKKKLSLIKRILVFSSAKGGVGKSICAAVSALSLSQAGFRTGLLDMDFQGASAHIFLGTELCFPEESRGIKPFRIKERLDFMSFAPFSREHPVPLRGNDVTQAMIELLAITVWDELDFLVVDMPPGIGDEVLDILRFMNRAEFIVITTPSGVVIRVVERLLEMLRNLEVPVVGIIENMKTNESPYRTNSCGERNLSNSYMAKRFQMKLLGSIPFIPDMDELVGRPDALLCSILGLTIKKIMSAITRQRGNSCKSFLGGVNG